MASARDRLQDSFDEIMAVANEFAAVARHALVVSLSSATERLVANHADFFNTMDADTARALRTSVDETIEGSADAIARELKDPDLWLHPNVFLEWREEREESRSWLDNPLFLDVVRVARRIADPPPEVPLDNPFNRVWIELSNGADRLDGVLLEFGFPPSDHPDWGGGRYGLQPQTVEELDPSGTLVRLWERYGKLHRRYRDLEERVGETSANQAVAEALRRWRDATPK